MARSPAGHAHPSLPLLGLRPCWSPCVDSHHWKAGPGPSVMDGSCRGLQSGRARGGAGRLSTGSSPRRKFANYALVRRSARAPGVRDGRPMCPAVGPWRRACLGPVGPPTVTAAPGLGCELASGLMVTRLYADLKSLCLWMKQHLHGVTSAVLQEEGIRSEVGWGEGRKVRQALGP